MSEDITTPPEEELFIPIELFGNDHWGVLLRVEEANKTSRGIIDPARLNIAYSKRSSFTPTIRFTGEYPTQIKANAKLRSDGRFGVKKVKGHDDIDCLGDLERAGLIEAEIPSMEGDKFIDSNGDVIRDSNGDPLSPFESPESLESAILKHTKWSLTDYGVATAFQLKTYKEAGTLHSFVAVQPHEAIKSI